MGWTASDINDQTGRVFLITGANSGLGLEATKALVAKNARVIAACRNLDKAKAALPLEGPGEVDIRQLDLGDLASVRAFATAVSADYPSIDVLMNNAGVMAVPRSETADGFEQQLGVNHLGHFALTGLLMPSVLAATDGRVVTVSSSAHRMGTMNFDDLHGKKSYQRWSAYGQSKLANLLFTLELQRRLTAAGAQAIALAAHPGYADTNLQYAHANVTGSGLEKRVMGVVNKVLAQSAEAGAWPQLYAAVAPGLTGGEFIGPGGIFESRGHPKVVQPNSKAKDAAAAERLWQESTAATGVEFPLPDPTTSGA